MPLSFTRAEEAEVGGKITARQQRALSNAVNSRLRPNIGDGAYRVGMAGFNLWRQVRNPDSSGLVFPSQGEWFDINQHIEPSHDIQLPVAGPGEPEGSNVANPMMQNIFGAVGSVDGEQFRLDATFPLWNGDNPPNSLFDIWELGKAQRGAYVNDSIQNVPALEAAQQFFGVTTPYFSPMGKAYGGFFPMPVELLTDCGSLSSDGLGVPSWEIKFTSLSDTVSTDGFHGTVTTNGDGNKVVTYAGSCPSWTALTAAGHVLAILRLPFAYYVVVNDGAGGFNVDRFAISEWLEGPYVGAGSLSRRDGGQIARSIWAFISEFRGTAEQRKDDTFKIKNIAFDFQEFFTRQYYLAPARGDLNGDGILASYPRFLLTADAAPQANLNFISGGTECHYQEGFIMAGVFAKATNLLQPVTLEVLSGDTVVTTLDLTPDESEAMLWLSTALKPEPLSVRVKDHLRLGTGGSLIFEATDQLDYKPEFWDTYLVLRLSATQGGNAEDNGVDGSGQDETQAKEIWEAYAENGCIVNYAAAGVRTQADWVNDNPLYEAERKRNRDYMRIMSRRLFRSYEVAGGKSILKFKRYAFGLDNLKVDAFHGIAPPHEPVESGYLAEGERYIVRNGSVTYEGSVFTDGQILTAHGSTEFQAHGAAELYVYDGIRHEAFKKGFSNEWLMFMQTHVYHPSVTSLWKPDAYADYFTWNNRCHFHTGSGTANSLKRHFNYGYGVDLVGDNFYPARLPEGVQAEFVSPEAPTGYNYALGSNQVNLLYNSYDFYKSCQIYQPPYEIESATVEFDGTGEEIVVLTFTTRFQATDTAPATVDPDPATWSGGEITDLANEAYRTDDNALREYALLQSNGTNQCTFKEGDAGTFSTVTGLPDNPFGSCYPHFVFVKLIPLPYEDDNDTTESHDSRALAEHMFQVETYLAAMCEGFIDDTTSTTITCENYSGDPISRLFDYTFENLCFDAFEGRQIGAFPLSIRDAGNAGHGPLPNTKLYAEVFNRLVKCVNKLTKARVMLPFSLECQTVTKQGEVVLPMQWPGAGAHDCFPGSDYRFLASGSPPAGSVVINTIPWSNCGSSVSAISIGFISTTCTPGNDWTLVSQIDEVEYRIAIDPNLLEAIPVLWRDQISNLGGVMVRETFSTTVPTCEDGKALLDSEQCFGIRLYDGTSGYDCDQTTTTIISCHLLSPGTITAGPPPGGIFTSMNDSGSGTCNNQSSSNRALDVLSIDEFFIDVPVEDYA